MTLVQIYPYGLSEVKMVSNERVQIRTFGFMTIGCD